MPGVFIRATLSAFSLPIGMATLGAGYPRFTHKRFSDRGNRAWTCKDRNCLLMPIFQLFPDGYGRWRTRFWRRGGIRTHGTVSPLRRIQPQNFCASRDASYGHEIRLTESSAAPLREETRRRFQDQMRRKMPGLPPRSKHSRECGPLSLEP
jgi:hypothetical protein